MYVYVYFVVRKSQCETTGAKGGKGGAARHKKKQAACSLTLSNSKIPVAKCAKKTMTAKTLTRFVRRNLTGQVNY